MVRDGGGSGTSDTVVLLSSEAGFDVRQGSAETSYGE
jgi:hypothetical protein